MKPRGSREPLANAGSRQLFILFVEDLKSIEKAGLFRQFCAGDTIDTKRYNPDLAKLFRFEKPFPGTLEAEH